MREIRLFKGARVVTMAGPDLDPGDVLVARGKIAAVGESLEAPRGAEVIDAKGKVIIPGLIDLHSALLLEPGAPPSAGRPESRAVDGLDPFKPHDIDSALAQGVTAVAVLPPARSGFTGRAALLELLPGASLEDMVVAEPFALAAAVGLGPYGRPIARLGETKRLGDALARAKDYREALEAYEEDLAEYVKAVEARAAARKKRKKKEQEKPGEGKSGKKETRGKGKEQAGMVKGPGEGGPPAGGGKGKEAKEEELPPKPAKPRFDAASEELLRVIKGENPLFVEVHRAADILDVLDLARAYPMKLVLVGCTEGWMVASEIAASGAGVVLGPPVRPLVLENDEFRNNRSSCAAVLAGAKVPVALASSGRDPGETRHLLLNAAEAVAAGLPRRKALAAVTVDAARLAGTGDSMGSIETGKEADLVVLDGDPLSSSTRVEAVYVKGKEVYRRGE